MSLLDLGTILATVTNDVRKKDVETNDANTNSINDDHRFIPITVTFLPVLSCQPVPSELNDPCECSSSWHVVDDESECGVDGNQGCSIPSRGIVTAEKNQEGHESNHELEGKESDSCQSYPWMNAVEMFDGCSLRYIVLGLNPSNGSNGYGRNGTNKQDGMENLVVDLLTTSEWLVHQHGLTIHEDESSHHKDCV